MATLDELQEKREQTRPRSEKPRARARSKPRSASPPSQPRSAPAARSFDGDLAQVAVMFAPSVLHALDKTVEGLRASGRKVGLAGVVRAALEDLPADPDATLSAARGERIAAREAADGGRGVERNVRIYTHQRAVLERAVAVLTERRVAGAQSLLVNAAVRDLIGQDTEAVQTRLDQVDAKREDAALAATTTA